MLIRSVLFNFQGAFLTRRFDFSQATLLLYHFRTSLSSGFSKIFEKVLKTSTEGHIPCGWRRHPDLNWGVRVLQTLALPLGYSAEIGADYEARTRYLHLGKVALYQMS